MIKHLFKLIWNKKKQNFLLMTEMLVSFIVMFVLFTLLVYYYQNYNRPIGLDYENVWVLGYDTPQGMSDADSIANFRASIKQMVKAMPQVDEVSFSNVNTPYSNNTISTSVAYNKINWHSGLYTVDDGYKNALNMTMKEGRWFSREDATATIKPVVINETFRKRVFGDEPATGKILGDAAVVTDQKKIIGVINDVKDNGDYIAPTNSYYRLIDTSNMNSGGMMLIKVKPTADAAFESKLYKALSNAMTNTSVDIQHMAAQRVRKNTQLLAPVIMLLIVGGFLVINVALGLFGVLWYNINRRRGEIGLRRAVGASGASISRQLVGESLVLSTISLIVGCFFAIQFPLLNVFNIESGTYLTAIGLDIIFIYILVLICSLYPGRQAAAIYPAEALHED